MPFETNVFIAKFLSNFEVCWWCPSCYGKVCCRGESFWLCLVSVIKIWNVCASHPKESWNINSTTKVQFFETMENMSQQIIAHVCLFFVTCDSPLHLTSTYNQLWTINKPTTFQWNILNKRQTIHTFTFEFWNQISNLTTKFLLRQAPS